jgi:hypothetical protein
MSKVFLNVRSLEKNECEKMNQNNQKNGVCDLIVEITNSLKSSDLIGYSIYNFKNNLNQNYRRLESISVFI